MGRAGIGDMAISQNLSPFVFPSQKTTNKIKKKDKIAEKGNNLHLQN